MSRSVLWVFACAVSVSACDDSPFRGLTDTLSAEIVTGDTTIFNGGAIVVRAQAEYAFGPGAPQTISWGVSDTAKIAAFILGDLSASVSAKDTGSAYVIARINDGFLDSILISVVQEGMLRWRASLSGPVALYPAITDDSLVVVTHGAGARMARSFTATGDEVFSLAACDGAMGASLAPGKIFTTGTACTARRDTAGGADWTLGFGSPGSGVALVSDGGAVVLHAVGQPLDAVAVSRISSLGVETWRDTLRSDGLAQASAPAIATNGDIYVPWRAPADSSWLSRIASDGTIRWTMPLPGNPHMTSPAISGNRIVIGHEGGISVFDTAGAVVWSHAFSDDLPGAAADARASSPVMDGAGNVFIQSVAGMVSYLPGGTTQWATDSVGFGPATEGVGAPVLLLDGTAVVACGGAVCGVRQSDGEQVWRSSVGGGSALGVVVGNAGTVFATRSTGAGAELLALWARSRVDPVGWPVAGRTTARTRRAN